MQSTPVATPHTLEAWLHYIESLHPKSIEMGLSRVRKVAQTLQLRFPYTVITVGGTNGKGSTSAMLENCYVAAGYQVGCYTSPHLLHYNERVRLQGLPVSDAMLCKAFAAVEAARGEVALTYFEMGTLAALWVFEQQPLQVVVLEVGLGGRLDAVNLVDADCAIVTNVDLDHMEFLGDTREAIGHEKAGIYRAGQIAICGDSAPPVTLCDYAQQLGVPLIRYGHDYRVDVADTQATYRDAQGEVVLGQLRLFGEYQWNNAANVIYAVRALAPRLPVAMQTLCAAIGETEVIGRFQHWHRQPDIILDVAHNPHAARALLDNLQRLKAPDSQFYAVFSMLADKDVTKVVDALHPVIDHWAIAPISHPRAASVDSLQQAIQRVSAQVTAHGSLQQALLETLKKVSNNDKIIVFGSFFTVAAILQMQSFTENASVVSTVISH